MVQKMLRFITSTEQRICFQNILFIATMSKEFSPCCQETWTSTFASERTLSFALNTQLFKNITAQQQSPI